jgi:hypothetical protein
MMKTQIEHLKKWQMPLHYFGASWPDYYSSGVGRSRDSDTLERANFDAMLKALKECQAPADWGHDFAPYQIVRESHWAVGWIEWIAIHESASEALAIADKLKGGLEDYPVIDEELFSQYETDEANTVWRDCYNARERIEYIRKHQSQFDFRDFKDLIGCIRGRYFAGYAGELLH